MDMPDMIRLAGKPSRFGHLVAAHAGELKKKPGQGEPGFQFREEKVLEDVAGAGRGFAGIVGIGVGHAFAPGDDPLVFQPDQQSLLAVPDGNAGTERRHEGQTYGQQFYFIDRADRFIFKPIR
jgi:hypothetical protein